MFKPSDSETNAYPEFDRTDAQGKEPVFVREIASHELGDLIRMNDEEMNEDFLSQKLYAVFDETGQRLAITNDRNSAFSFAKMHDYAPASVH